MTQRHPKKATTRDLAKRVAARRLVEGSEWSHLAPILLHGSSKVQMALEGIQEMVNRTTRLIDSSPQKEHIYGEAGDMITGVRNLLGEATEGAAILSYAAGKVNEKKLKRDFSPTLKDDIDTAIKKGDL